jgi:hypothetical protein
VACANELGQVFTHIPSRRRPWHRFFKAAGRKYRDRHPFAIGRSLQPSLQVIANL